MVKFKPKKHYKICVFDGQVTCQHETSADSLQKAIETAERMVRGGFDSHYNDEHYEFDKYQVIEIDGKEERLVAYGVARREIIGFYREVFFGELDKLGDHRQCRVVASVEEAVKVLEDNGGTV